MTENAHTPGPKTVPEVLNAAADLLERPGAWTQGDYARDDMGLGIGDYTEEEREKGGFEPVCFCTIGAINHARGRDPDTALWGDLRRPIWDVLGETNIADWNDAPGRTQAEVVAALREAAAKATGAPSHD